MHDSGGWTRAVLFARFTKLSTGSSLLACRKTVSTWALVEHNQERGHNRPRSDCILCRTPNSNWSFAGL